MRTAPYPNPANTWDGGILLPGWHCRAEDCGLFNGEEKVKWTHCRRCNRPRGWLFVPEADDPGSHDCTPVPIGANLEHHGHAWLQDGSGICSRCGARAIRGCFGDLLREKKKAKEAAP